VTTFFVDTGGSANNPGTSDANSPAANGSAATVSGSVVTLDGSPSLAFLSGRTSGATQAAIYLNDATNANQKIFKITAYDDTAKTVTVSVAPTGVTSSSWAIDGRHVFTSANIEATFTAGDQVVLNNTPASKAVDFLTCRTPGDSASGFIKFRGASGSRPVLQVTNTNQCIEGGSQALWWFENLELDQDGASGNVAQATGAGTVFYNVKVSDGGGAGITASTNGHRLIGNEVTGILGDAISFNTLTVCHGNNLHDVSGDGIENNGTSAMFVSFNVIDTCAGRGIFASSTSITSPGNPLFLTNNTVYGCGDTGFEVADADAPVVLVNSIFSENGNAAGEYNVEWTAGAAENVSFHAWNNFYHSGGGGGANLSGLTVNAHVASSEFTTDPQFTDAAGGNFSIGSSSPAKAAGFPGAFLG